MYRILQVCPALKTGGVERSVLEMAQHLGTQDTFQIQVAAASGPLAADILATGARWHRLPLHWRNPLHICYCALRLVRIIRREGIHLLHARSRGPAWACWLASRLSGVPYVSTFHGTYGAHNALKRWYNSSMLRGAAVIANSQFIRAHIYATYQYPREILVAPRGFDSQRLHPGMITQLDLDSARGRLALAADVPVIVCVGRLTRWKGQHVLLQALAHLTALHWHCVLIGPAEGDYPVELAELIQSLALTERVTILGPRQDVATWYKLAAVVVSPSIKPEAFGRVSLEAQAMGTPVIATNHGGSVETVQPGVTGWLIPPRDATPLAQTLHEALTNPAQLRNMGQAAIGWAQNFTTAQTCEAEKAVYRQVLQNTVPVAQHKQERRMS